MAPLQPTPAPLLQCLDCFQMKVRIIVLFVIVKNNRNTQDSFRREDLKLGIFANQMFGKDGSSISQLHCIQNAINFI
jgi:hypothetical protein